MKTTLSIILITIGAALFGTGYVVSTLTLDYGLTPLELVTLRMFFGALFLNIVFFKKIKTLNKYELKTGIIVGILIFGTFAFHIGGLNYTTASINAFITITYVVLVPFICLIFNKKSLDIYSIIGAILTLIGVGFISLQDGELYMSIGILITFVGAVFSAFYIFYLESLTQKVEPMKITIVMLNVCFIISLITTIIISSIRGSYMEFTSSALLKTLYLGIICTAAPYSLLNIGQRYTSATKAGILISTEAIFGTVFAIIFLNEIINVSMIIGFLLIFVAIIIAETKLKFFKKK